MFCKNVIFGIASFNNLFQKHRTRSYGSVVIFTVTRLCWKVCVNVYRKLLYVYGENGLQMTRVAERVEEKTNETHQTIFRNRPMVPSQKTLRHGYIKIFQHYLHGIFIKKTSRVFSLGTK